MTLGEIIKTLVTAPNYVDARLKVEDSVIEFIKEELKRDYELFREKEEIFQTLKKIALND